MKHYLKHICLALILTYIVANILFVFHFRNELAKKLSEDQARALILDTLEVELPNWGIE